MTNHKNLKNLSTALTLLGVMAAAGAYAVDAKAQDTFPNGVGSGDTTQSSSVLWARSLVPGMVSFEISTKPNFDFVEDVEFAEVSDVDVPAKVQVNGLLPGQIYFYRATDASGNSATGRFTTARDRGEFAGLRFGVSGDSRGELSPYPSIRNADKRHLDVFVEHGDTAYTDRRSPALDKPRAETLQEFRVKHAEIYSTRFGANTWANLRAATSILATIDDHEVRNDFAGGASPASDPRFADDPAEFINDTALYDNGLQAFQEYNPLRDEFYGDTNDPVTAFERKLYRFNDYGSDAALIVLDARSFRDEALPEVQNPLDPAQVAAFLVASFTPLRTMLGEVQLADLKADLLEAQDDGTTWKFVLVPEPIQNFGVIAAEDRFEGYAAERTELLRFIDENNIENVVFIAADVHGTLVNNLTYQEEPFGPQIATTAFEITTGPVAFDAPFGPSTVDLAAAVGVISAGQKAFYDSLPRDGKDQFVSDLVNSQLAGFGYDPLGLDDNLPIADGFIDAKLLRGGYVATHSFGWTEFRIKPKTQRLTVTTYAVDPYTEEELLADPEAILAREPEVVSKFVVVPGGLGAAVASASGS